MLWSLGDRKQREEKILVRTKIPFPKLSKAMQPFLHVENCKFLLSPHGNTRAWRDVQCPRCSSRTCCVLRSPVLVETEPQVQPGTAPTSSLHGGPGAKRISLNLANSLEILTMDFMCGSREDQWVLAKMGWRILHFGVVSEQTLSRALRLLLGSNSKSRF